MHSSNQCVFWCNVGSEQLKTVVVMDAVLGACQATKGVKTNCKDGVGDGAL